MIDPFYIQVHLIIKQNKMSEQLTILIADEYPLIREAWSFMLNHDRRFRVIA